MRGNDAVAGSLFSYVDLEKRVRPDHPLRVIRGLVNRAGSPIRTFTEGMPKTSHTEVTSQTKTAKLKAT